MSTASGSTDDEQVSEYRDLKRILTVADLQHGPRLSPKQIVYFYSADQWEDFVEEWTKALAQRYVKVERVGGANDKGVDVAAFLTASGYEGEWDCYQCKNYSSALGAYDARQEILKILRAVLEGFFILPRRYLFVSPKGCSGSLSKLLNSPSKLRDDFLKNLEAGKPLAAGLDQALLSKIRHFAASIDFSVFNAADLADIIEDIKGTPSYLARFGGNFPGRPVAETPPDTPRPHEARYLEQLVEVHRERFGSVISCTDDALSHPDSSVHIRRQRVAFYSAETLRLFARDNVPRETFEDLQNEVLEGVVDIHEGAYAGGYERLNAVMAQSATLQLSNALVLVTTLVDRKGICHQLANVDKLRWCRSAP